MKETRKQIVEQTRNKLSRKHQQELGYVMEKFDAVSSELEEARKKNQEYEKEIDSLKNDLRELKEFNKELMFLADITDEDVRKAKLIEHFQTNVYKTFVTSHEYNDFSLLYRGFTDGPL